MAKSAPFAWETERNEMSMIDHNRAGRPYRSTSHRDAIRSNRPGFGRGTDAVARFEGRPHGREKGHPPG